MERQVITVDIAPGNSQVERLGSSQGDIGRPMGVYVIQNGVALDCSAYSVELYILKPDGKFYTTQATVDATETNLIKWETAMQETPVAGACAAQIRIAAGDEDIGTARFVEFVEAAPGDMGAASESEVALLTEYVRQARESATSAGSDATTASGAASSASGSASTATTAANTATQAASAAIAAAERAEEVEESIPADYSQLSDDVTGLKSVFDERFALPSESFQQGAYGASTSVHDKNTDSLYTKRIGYASANKFKTGDSVYFDVGSNAGITISVFANVPGVNQTVLQRLSTGWVSGAGNFELLYDGYIIINIRNSDDSNIAPADYNYKVEIAKTFENTESELLKIKSALNVHDKLTEEKAFESWTKGAYTATGGIDTNVNGVVSSIQRYSGNDVVVLPYDDCRAVLLLYQNGAYVGKVNTSGEIDKLSGNWKNFRRLINVGQYVTGVIDSYSVGLIDLENTIITNDTKDAYGNSHAIIKTACFDNADLFEDVLEVMPSDSFEGQSVTVAPRRIKNLVNVLPLALSSGTPVIYTQSALTIGQKQVDYEIKNAPFDIISAEIDYWQSRIKFGTYCKVFDGTEAFTAGGANGNNFVLITNFKGCVGDNPSCNVYESSAYVYNYTGDTIKVAFGYTGYEERIIFMTPPGAYTVATFKQYLKDQYDNDSPVIVWYNLESSVDAKADIDRPLLTTGSTVSASAGTVRIDYFKEIDLQNWDNATVYFHGLFKTHMTHNGNGTYSGSETRNAIVSPVYFDSPVKITIPSNRDIAIQTFDGYEIGPNHLINAGPWLSNTTYTVPAQTYFCMIVRNSNDSITDDHTQDSLVFELTKYINDIYTKLLSLYDRYSKAEDGSYLEDINLNRIPVITEFLGTVKYLQSFCIYNGYYYSIDGTHLCKQTANFEDVATADVNTGHGNALQLGNSNIAYASGWDDQKIYKVNLDTMESAGVITLPTTGYTTCAVDEVRGLVYIFQRDTVPSTEDYYNYIVYDYVNEEIKSTRKVSLPFAAMQAIDLYKDRLIVLNGLGTSAAPDYYRMYSLDGDLIGEYILPGFSGYEPEGVCIDRATGELVMGLNGKYVYKVSTLI